MRRLIRIFALLASGAAAACLGPRTARPPATPDCPRTPEPEAVRADSIPFSRLAGRSRLIFLDTVNPQLPPTFAQVNLRPPDSAFLTMLDEINRQAVRFDPSARPRQTPPLLDFREGEAMWLAGPFFMSNGECLSRCMDASPTLVSFRYLTTRSVRGVWWNNMTGIAVMTDPKTGRRLPSPAGIVCMIAE